MTAALFDDSPTPAEMDEAFALIDSAVEKNIWPFPAGKTSMAKGLIEMFPPHQVYTEAFIGGGACFFRKEQVPTEVINDLDEEIAHAYMAIKSLTDSELASMERFDWKSSGTRYTQLMAQKGGDKLTKLHRFLYLTRFSFGRQRGKGWDKSEAGIISRIPKRLEKHRPRLQKTHIFSKDYEQVCMQFDGPNSFHFLDPPYVGYSHGVREKDFDEDRFFKFLVNMKGKFLVTYGIRGRLPKMVRQHKGFEVRLRKPRRQLGNAGRTSNSKTLYTMVITNYPVTQKMLQKSEDDFEDVTNLAEIDKILAEAEKTITSAAVADSGKKAPARADDTFVEEDLHPPMDLPKVIEEETTVVKVHTDHSDGAMVAFYPSLSEAQKFALDGGQEPESLHITLAYLGKASDLDADVITKIRDVVRHVASDSSSVSGQISGVGRFSIPDGEDAVYASYDSVEIATFRERLVKALEEVGVPVARNHGFTPHMTLAYVADGEKLPVDRVQAAPLSFSKVSLVIGGEREDVSFGVAKSLTTGDLLAMTKAVAARVADEFVDVADALYGEETKKSLVSIASGLDAMQQELNGVALISKAEYSTSKGILRSMEYLSDLISQTAERIPVEAVSLLKGLKAGGDALVEFGGLLEDLGLRRPIAKALSSDIEICKQAEERYALGIVLEPNDPEAGLDPDAQKDVYSAEDIRKAAHFYMATGGRIKLMHREFVDSHAIILESYIAPVSFIMNQTTGEAEAASDDFDRSKLKSDERFVKKGTWLLALRFDSVLWPDVRSGKLKGLSVGGFAQREPLKDSEAKR